MGGWVAGKGGSQPQMIRRHLRWGVWKRAVGCKARKRGCICSCSVVGNGNGVNVTGIKEFLTSLETLRAGSALNVAKRCMGKVSMALHPGVNPCASQSWHRVRAGGRESISSNGLAGSRLGRGGPRGKSGWSVSLTPVTVQAPSPRIPPDNQQWYQWLPGTSADLVPPCHLSQSISCASLLVLSSASVYLPFYTGSSQPGSWLFNPPPLFLWLSFVVYPSSHPARTWSNSYNHIKDNARK